MILAIDLGSTSFKAAVFDRRLRLMTSGSGRLRYRFGAGGLVELDVAVVHAALRCALDEARVRDHDIKIVALTSQAQTFTWVDARGRARMPFLSWQDTRSATDCVALKLKLKGFSEHSSFSHLFPGLQVCQLRRLRSGGQGMPLLLPSYILRLWTGEAITDNNIAAMSGLYSMITNGWWPAALRACGLSESQLPRVIQVGEIAAETTSAAQPFGLPRGVPVVLAGNDQTAGGFGAGLEKRQELLISLGTAQVAYTCHRTMPRLLAGASRGPYPGGLFYRMAADRCGGNVVNWAQAVLAGCTTPAGFDAVAASSPAGCRGVVFEPGDAPEGGAWRNIGLHHGPGDLARAVLESLARRMAHMVSTIYPGPLPVVNVAGGGAQSVLWRDILAKELGVPVVLTRATPLAGAARLADNVRRVNAQMRSACSGNRESVKM
ncbi:MAG: FGGY-family carbohydrate kinase [Verrucomicrobia bacterium]|nr:FGGY-family carbohydrate kinase [Verrucomicrobiota bacterium]